MPEWLKVLFLGIVEGITEFLPISSTGHLLVFSALLDFEKSLGGTFEIFIQSGAVAAVIGYYFADLRQQARDVRTDPAVQRLWLAVVVAALPAAVAGFLFRNIIKNAFFPPENSPTVVAITLIIGGLIFLLVERRPARAPNTLTLRDITLRQALWIGVIQTLALIPGVSRSGASIIGGILVGMNRPTATAFSFYLSIPVLGGATVVDLLLSLDNLNSSDLAHLLAGAVVSGVVAWFAIDWLLRYVARRDFVPFAYYRIAAGAVIILLLAVGSL